VRIIGLALCHPQYRSGTLQQQRSQIRVATLI
jgi:hypothetical protein